MFKVFLVILGLAAYGAYALVGAISNRPDAPVAPQASGFGSLAWSAVAEATGLNTVPLPETGCQENTLSQSNLIVLAAALPDEQREALLRLADLSESAVVVQWYSGSAGVGVCLPAQNRLVLLPQQASQTIAVLFPASAP